PRPHLLLPAGDTAGASAAPAAAPAAWLGRAATSSCCPDACHRRPLASGTLCPASTRTRTGTRTSSEKRRPRFMNTSPACCANRRSRGRNYEAELQRCHPEGLPVEFGDYHPLKPIMVTDTKTRRGARKGSTSSSSSSSSSAPMDPLSSMLDGTDPLSMFAATETSPADPAGETLREGTKDLGRKRRVKEEEALGADFEPWSTKRGEILARFTTTEKLSIVSVLFQWTADKSVLSTRKSSQSRIVGRFRESPHSPGGVGRFGGGASLVVTTC
uniref:Uncharacterized protein n=1 Tax=Xiphophorus couchianus TaxID=32473 RepID=A0A3B5KUV9_9TELE